MRRRTFGRTRICGISYQHLVSMKAAQNLLLLSRRAQICQRAAIPKVVPRFHSHKNAIPSAYFPVQYGIRSLHIGSDKRSDTASASISDVPLYSDVPGVQSSGEKMIIMFTCTVCDTRSARKISKQAYNEGIVMVRCDCCKNRHLIADRMGVFEDSVEGGGGWDIQSYLAQRTGEQAKKITDENVFELTMEDIMGAKAAAAYRETTTGVVGADDATKTDK